MTDQNPLSYLLVYADDNRRVPNTRSYTLERLAKTGRTKYLNRHVRHGRPVTREIVVMDSDKFAFFNKGRTRMVTNIMTGLVVEIPDDTPRCCDPSSELYHSM